MNFNDFQQIYQVMIDTYKLDRTLNVIQVHFQIDDIINEKKFTIINVDIRSKKNPVKLTQHKKI